MLFWWGYFCGFSVHSLGYLEGWGNDLTPTVLQWNLLLAEASSSLPTSINSPTLESLGASSYSPLSQTETSSSFSFFFTLLLSCVIIHHLFICFVVACRLQRRCRGMKLKIKSMSHVWFYHPPTPKKAVKKKKIILVKIFFLLGRYRHFFQRWAARPHSR